MFPLRIPHVALPFLLLATACLSAPGAHARAGASETERLHLWLDEQYAEELRFTPEELTSQGSKALYDRLNDYSDEGEQRQLDWLRRSVASMRADFDREALDDEGALSYDFWAYRLQRAEDRREFADHRYAFSQVNDPHVELPKLLINDHRVDTAADLEAYIRRLNGIGVAMRQNLERAKTAADRNIRAPRFAYDTVIDQATRVISGAPFDDGDGESALWRDARGKIDALLQTSVISAREAHDYEEQVRAALLGPLREGYREVIAWLREDREQTSEQAQGVHALPRGKAFYAERLRYNTTTELTAEDIHAIGKAEVARLQDAMQGIVERVDFDGSLQDFFSHVREDSRFYYPDTATGRRQYIEDTEAYLDEIEEELPDYFGLLPKADLVVRRVEAFRERDGGAAHYVSGTPDGDRPGVYYLHLSDMRSNNLTDLQTTAYHEGNPGHHMQISIAQENASLPDFRRNLWYSAYGEGWALYAEQVAAEMGLVTDPYNEFGRLTAEIFRAIRLVVDTGLHHYAWTEEEAVQYMLDNSALPEGMVRSEIRRYIAWPGQATSYKVGMLKILELRREAQADMGEDFDIRGFHDAVLGGGSLPLHLLERRVQQWADRAPAAPYRAELVRTSHGVAHITADDFAGLGYGEGFAAAEDQACDIAHSLLQARGELARYLGAGNDNAHLIQDAVVRAMDIAEQTATALAAQSDEDVDWLEGYAAGFNRYLRDNGGVGDAAWCAGEPWVRQISASDLMARMVLVAQTLPRMAGAIAGAAPPAASAVADARGVHVPERQIAAAWQAAGLQGMGSNAWALGRERTESGRGILIGNPHYPWYGANRFWEKHLTIPGRLDVYGVHLLGAPGVAIGFTESVGWSHTVSDSQRLVFYRLQLVPGDPTSYLVDGEPRKMRRETVAVPVLGEDGSVSRREHSVYFSHHGPVLTLPGMPWTETQAFAARDANRDNHFLLPQWKAMNSADSMDAFIEAHRIWNALPWVNTIAASADGRAVYLDNSSVGHLSDDAIARWNARRKTDALTRQLHSKQGMILLDGSDSGNDWQRDAAARVPGTTPFEARPRLERPDYVFNSNDSYWLSNVEHPLTDYSPLYGPTATARSLRTRMNATILTPDSPYDYAGEDGRFSLGEAQEALLANRSLTAELLLDDLQDICATGNAVMLDDDTVELAGACNVLADFDGHMNEDSLGAVLFREWLAQFDYDDTLRAGDLFQTPFDVQQPLTTPHTLASAETARTNLARAVRILEAAGLPLDATLGSTQFARFAGGSTPIHGGNGREGVTNLILSGEPDHPLAPPASAPVEGSSLLTEDGYTVVHGSSFILALAFEDTGPRAEVLLTYGQSGDPASPYFDSQTELFRQREWRQARFTPEAIADDTLTRRVLEEAR